VPKLSINFEEILSRVHRSFKTQNKVLESSIIIIDYCIIINNAYYNYNCIINSQYNNYISNAGLLKECDKDEKLEVTGVSITSCLKRRL
jgi:hypothetical protein